MKKHVCKKIAALLLSALLLVTLFAGCSNGSSDGSGASTSDSGKLQIQFWHSMSGNTQEALDAVVAGFNESQDQYEVVATNQGTYDESTGKFFNMAGGSDSAHIIQIGEQNLQSMIDSGMIASVSDLIETYSFDDSDLLEQEVNFYTVDGDMWAMPFNCSTPVVYYNKTVFDAAGVTEFPTTFEGITEAAQKVAESNDSITPVGMYAYGYALDQMVINMGGYVINNENGRADRATEVSYQDQITQIYNWIKDLQDQELLLNYGSDGTNTISGFTQQQVGMFIASSASCRNVIDSSTDFEVGVANLPVPEGTEPEGVYGGGGALCVATGLDEDVEAGVMEFLTYATSPEVQATWAVSTGYFPICNGAYETETLTSTYEELPQLQVAADQLLNSNVNSITAGPLLSQLPQLRTDLQTALEAVFNGSDVESAVAQAVESTNSAIASANQGVAE
ncbi:MAG TPA: ABC transporter substrate-binding protein [Candidatus Acutalibacter pullicola]|uniref:ABC transporter substrate-binding protein n=1 Tax=Candidatus Acutalibacter pullicola TaxID=2838417 RepID=A0A9D2MWT7_9FIRM|nr:ABC transporter substrate-binding protein [Candidatus Acutalibacter pullicola]